MAKKKNSQNEENNQNTAIWVAIIGGIVSIILAILAFPPLTDLINSKWNPTPTPIPTDTSIPSETASVRLEDTFTPNPINFSTQSPTDVPTSTLENNKEFMTVILIASANEGRMGSTVNFNARDSYVTFPDATTSTCINQNVCTFQWDVRLDGLTIYGPVQNGNTFSYKFEKKGSYTIVVFVCRGNACNYSAASVTIK